MALRLMSFRYLFGWVVDSSEWKKNENGKIKHHHRWWIKLNVFCCQTHSCPGVCGFAMTSKSGDSFSLSGSNANSITWIYTRGVCSLTPDAIKAYIFLWLLLCAGNDGYSKPINYLRNRKKTNRRINVWLYRMIRCVVACLRAARRLSAFYTSALVSTEIALRRMPVCMAMAMRVLHPLQMLSRV